MRNSYIPRRARRDHTRQLKDRLNITIPTDAKRAFDKAAFTAGMSLSQWIEMAGRKALEIQPAH